MPPTPQTVQALLDHGANTGAQDLNARTPLMNAAFSGNAPA